MTAWIPPPPDNATRLLLVRHGEPDEAVRGRCYGRLDVALSPRGEAQMRHLARLVAGAGAACVYSSPSRRALDSARIVSGPAIAIDPRLHELDFGDCEGLTYDAIADRHPAIYAAWMARPTGVTFPGGESYATMAARVEAALADIRRRHARQTVTIVSHGGVNRIALASALGLDPIAIFRLDQAFGCMNIIDYIGDGAIVRLVNGTASPC